MDLLDILKALKIIVFFVGIFITGGLLAMEIVDVLRVMKSKSLCFLCINLNFYVVHNFLYN